MVVKIRMEGNTYYNNFLISPEYNSMFRWCCWQLVTKRSQNYYKAVRYISIYSDTLWGTLTSRQNVVILLSHFPLFFFFKYYLEWYVNGVYSPIFVHKTNFVQVAFDSLNWARSLICFYSPAYAFNYIELSIFFLNPDLLMTSKWPHNDLNIIFSDLRP